MPKRIAVIATKAKFKEIRRFFRKSFSFPLDSSTDDYLAVMELFLYRIDSPKSKFIGAYDFTGYIDLVGYNEIENAFSNAQKDLIDCIDMMEEDGVRIWNAAKVCREIEMMALPF